MNSSGEISDVFLNWYSKSSNNLKFKYNKSDSKWVDLDAIISLVTLTYNETQNVFVLKREDAKSLTQFVQRKK